VESASLAGRFVAEETAQVGRRFLLREELASLGFFEPSALLHIIRMGHERA
jgi:hypothetical protein